MRLLQQSEKQKAQRLAKQLEDKNVQGHKLRCVFIVHWVLFDVMAWMVQAANRDVHHRRELTEANKQVFSREQFENDVRILTTKARAIATEHTNLLFSALLWAFTTQGAYHHKSM